MSIALGIESSCDDCSVSIVRESGEVLFLTQKNQDQFHKKFGGIVPELASRQHENVIFSLIDQALKVVSLSDIDCIAVTNRPGLLGSLLVGCVTAKTLSLSWNKALVGVNHIEAHIFSSLLFNKAKQKKISIKWPVLAFVVSGGHSSLFYVEDIGKAFLLAETRDDSAGEAFDKFARLLGFDWPGGPQLDKIAQNSQHRQHFFSEIKTDDLSFSFSGIKSQGQRLLDKKSKAWLEQNKTDVCADYQEKIVNHLMTKLDQAFEKNPVKQVLIGGGVSANSLFRKRLKKWSQKKSVSCHLPELEFCIDNGAMIAWTGLQYFLRGQTDGLSLKTSPRHLDNDFFKRLSY
ncbi:MAG: tRNA (adenosine(37)-N6)-threonylcarbamoyltransferase complex transferase subunit TsaD [Bdellovibrionaceae bacterium]|nr:tRNA (adenosine(37)-N6)-threonylcarbamoyltransferase complex transferase subunit TsaD [Pseudobdellovibrionaceae bacterium]